MIEFFSWYRSAPPSGAPWLVVGKGPSYERIGAVNVGEFRVFALNHAIALLKAEVAHLIDLDVVDACGEALLSNAGVVVMPWVPHVGQRPGDKTLEETLETSPVLAQLDAEGRLLWYNKIGSRRVVPVRPGSPPVKVVNFSAEAAYALLGAAGATVIRSVGIDGGASYADPFRSLGTLLQNDQPSFDSQFAGIAESVFAYGIDAAPVGVEAPVRVFVAATEVQMLSVKVLEYSIRRRSSISAVVTPMHITAPAQRMPMPVEPANWPRTPFSFQRFMIPELAGYAGHAVYLDSDMQVFSDIRELWCTDMQGRQLLTTSPDGNDGRKPQYSVMLLDCSKLSWKIEDIVAAMDAGDLTYATLMHDMCLAPDKAADLNAGWNSLEKFQHGKTRLVHYTDMDTQPWIYAFNPLGYLWVRDLIAAVDQGFISLDLIREHARLGWVRPTLPWQVEHRMEDAHLLPKEILALDRFFVPPFHGLHAEHRKGLRMGWQKLKARLRHWSDRSVLLSRAYKAVFVYRRRVMNRLRSWLR